MSVDPVAAEAVGIINIATSDATIRSARLDLVPFPEAALEALLADDAATASALVGVALPEDLGRRSQALFELRLGDLRHHPGAEAWLLRVVALRRPERPMIGLTGFHGPPDITGSVELGYEIDPPYRLRGYAVETADALATWALTDGRANRVMAAIRPDNQGSLAVVARLGFAAAGSRWDAIDGTALLFERRNRPRFRR
jgi:ribosomal-protein-alanine N-acetyltransferase